MLGLVSGLTGNLNCALSRSRAHPLKLGKPGETIPKLVKELDASALVTDFIPLRVGRQWKDEVG